MTIRDLIRLLEGAAVAVGENSPVYLDPNWNHEVKYVEVFPASEDRKVKLPMVVLK